MRILLSIFFISLLLTGCGDTTLKAATPTDEVKNFFSKYTSLDTEVVNQLNDVIDEENLTDKQKVLYKEVFKKQYKALKYNIIDEQINNNNATVSTKIEVYDYYNVKKSADEYLITHPTDFNNAEGKFDEKRFWDYKLEQLSITNIRRSYTMDLTLTRIDGNWRLDNLLDAELQKIHGLYQG